MHETGLGWQMLQSAAALRESGCDVDIIWASAMAPRLGRKIRRLVLPILIALRLLRAGRKRFDLAEVHEPSAWASVMLAKIVPRMPCVVVMSHGLEQRHQEVTVLLGGLTSAWRLGWHKISVSVPSSWAVRHATAVMVLNETDRAFAVDVIGAQQTRVHVVPNGVGEIASARERPRPGYPRFLFLGSWLPRKGSRLIEALLAGNEIDLTIAGGGVNDPALRAAHGGQPVSRDGVRELLARHDVLLLPSYFEGMPLVVLEAAAAGLAIVATGIGGIVDVFPRGEEDGALLISPGSVQELTASVARLSSDPGLPHQLGQRAQAAVSPFTWSRVGSLQHNVFLAALTDR